MLDASQTDPREEINRLRRRVADLERRQREQSNIAQRDQDNQRNLANTALLESLARLQREFIVDANPRQSFGGMLALLLEYTASEYGFIGEIRRQSDGQPYLKTHAVTNIAWNEETRAFHEENAPTSLEFYQLDNLFGLVLTTGETVVANDAANDPRSGGTPPSHPALHAFLGLPFRHADELIGMIGIANRPGGYDREMIDALAPLASTCAVLV
ncbi:MAG: GAF domain-containing protein, partial [Planctomycetales bacterium]